MKAVRVKPTPTATQVPIVAPGGSGGQGDGSRTTFVVPGRPVPRARHRVVVTPAGHVRAYTPETTVAAKLAIAWEAKAAGLELLEGPVFLSCDFVFSGSRSHRAGHHDKRPDLDSLLALVLDALTGIAYLDDAQVSTLVGRKGYSQTEPYTRIMVRADDMSWAVKAPPRRAMR